MIEMRARQRRVRRKMLPGNYKCDVQNVCSVIHLATQRPNRKIGLAKLEGMRANFAQPMPMCFQYLKRRQQRLGRR